MNYISFIDLLGIKEIAKHDPPNYFSRMENFREVLRSIGEHFSETNNLVEVYFYSDCAFVESSNFLSLVNFLVYVRRDLSNRGDDTGPIYFSAAISRGTLEAEIFSEGNVHGTIFKNSDVAEVFVSHTNFKGIGITVGREIVENFLSQEQFLNERKNNGTITSAETDHLRKVEENLSLITSSFFISSGTVQNLHVKGYYDIKLSARERGNSYLTRFLNRYHDTNSRSKDLGKYYVSYLANWINSSDFSSIDAKLMKEDYPEINFDGDSSADNDNKPEELPIIYRRLIRTPDFRFRDLRKASYGFDYLLFALINKIFKDRLTNDEVTNYLFKEILDMKVLDKYFSKISAIGDEVIKNKDRLISNRRVYLQNHFLNR